MPIVSHAQNFEDIMLHRALKHVSPGFFIDVGAHHHEADSVSLLFSKIGWTGIHVEPMAHLARALAENRPQDKVLQVAVGSGSGPLKLYEVGGGVGLTTGDRDYAERHARNGYVVREVEVQKRSLADILNSEAPEEVHWLKIDVEGMEGDVIKSWQGSTKRPWVVLLESTLPGSQEPSYEDWEPNLVELGYKFVYFDGLNRFYVSVEHPELERFFNCGPNVFDDVTVTQGHWIARGLVAFRSKPKKGIPGLIQKIRIFSKPLRYRIKSWFRRGRKDNSGRDFSPVPGMSMDLFNSFREESAGISQTQTKTQKR